MNNDVLRYDHVYFLAANQIGEMLDRRGFVTDSSKQTEGLIEEITDIIRKTIEGNCNKTVTTSTSDEVETISVQWNYNGWEDDLQNKIY